jgi:hypothetical protein
MKSAGLDQGRIREEHGGKDELKYNLCPHMKHNSNKVVLLFSPELLLCELVLIVVLITKDVMQ